MLKFALGFLTCFSIAWLLNRKRRAENARFETRMRQCLHDFTTLDMRLRDFLKQSDTKRDPVLFREIK